MLPGKWPLRLIVASMVTLPEPTQNRPATHRQLTIKCAHESTGGTANSRQSTNHQIAAHRAFQFDF